MLPVYSSTTTICAPNIYAGRRLYDLCFTDHGGGPGVDGQSFLFGRRSVHGRKKGLMGRRVLGAPLLIRMIYENGG
jgi:hypothetical protein